MNLQPLVLNYKEKYGKFTFGNILNYTVMHPLINKKIETKDKRRIAKDWLSVFNGFYPYKPMHFVRRNGPFLCGILLERHSGNLDYEPTFHVHNLMVDFPVVSLGSATYLLNPKGVKDRITLYQHSECFNRYVERFKEQTPLLQENKVNCKNLISHFQKVIDTSLSYPADSLKDWVLALFWCGEMEEAEKAIAYGKKIISQWPEGAKSRFNGEDGWEQQIRRLMNKGMLQDTVEKELAKFKLSNIVDYTLQC
ncbi:MAG: hypothetical protein LUG18_09355 [Candidatus Azobacteroides sp.]|nr:hypothetical protein [Candidatus Azobacteroides sp.]